MFWKSVPISNHLTFIKLIIDKPIAQLKEDLDYSYETGTSRLTKQNDCRIKCIAIEIDDDGKKIYRVFVSTKDSNNYERVGWVAHAEISNCMTCKKGFIPLFRTKHNCHACGNVICESCSPKSIRIIELTNLHRHRVCNACWKDEPEIHAFTHTTSFDNPFHAVKPENSDLSTTGNSATVGPEVSSKPKDGMDTCDKALSCDDSLQQIMSDMSTDSSKILTETECTSMNILRKSVTFGEAVENTVNKASEGIDTFGKALAYYDNLRNLTSKLDRSGVLDLPDVNLAMQTVGNIVIDVLPGIVETTCTLGEQVPFLGILSAASLILFKTAKNVFETDRLVKDICHRVREVIVWFRQDFYRQYLQQIKNNYGDELLTLISGNMQELIQCVLDANRIIEEWNKANIVNKVWKADFTGTEMMKIPSRIDEAKSNISFNGLPLIMNWFKSEFDVIAKSQSEHSDETLEKIRSNLDDPVTSFLGDINTHLERVLEGSREWMQTVSEPYVSCNICLNFASGIVQMAS